MGGAGGFSHWWAQALPTSFAAQRSTVTFAVPAPEAPSLVRESLRNERGEATRLVTNKAPRAAAATDAPHAPAYPIPAALKGNKKQQQRDKRALLPKLASPHGAAEAGEFGVYDDEDGRDAGSDTCAARVRKEECVAAAADDWAGDDRGGGAEEGDGSGALSPELRRRLGGARATHANALATMPLAPKRFCLFSPALVRRIGETIKSRVLMPRCGAFRIVRVDSNASFFGRDRSSPHRMHCAELFVCARQPSRMAHHPWSHGVPTLPLPS
jgi:hypothetical protein